MFYWLVLTIRLKTNAAWTGEDDVSGLCLYYPDVSITLLDPVLRSCLHETLNRKRRRGSFNNGRSDGNRLIANIVGGRSRKELTSHEVINASNSNVITYRHFDVYPKERANVLFSAQELNPFNLYDYYVLHSSQWSLAYHDVFSNICTGRTSLLLIV